MRLVSWLVSVRTGNRRSRLGEVRRGAESGYSRMRLLCPKQKGDIAGQTDERLPHRMRMSSYRLPERMSAYHAATTRVQSCFEQLASSGALTEMSPRDVTRARCHASA